MGLGRFDAQPFSLLFLKTWPVAVVNTAERVGRMNAVPRIVNTTQDGEIHATSTLMLFIKAMHMYRAEQAQVSQPTHE